MKVRSIRKMRTTTHLTGSAQSYHITQKLKTPNVANALHICWYVLAVYGLSNYMYQPDVGSSFLCFNGAFRQDVGTHVGVKSGSKPGF